MKTFEVVRIEKRQLVVTGKGKHPLWDKANTLSDFCRPIIVHIPIPMVSNRKSVFLNFKTDALNIKVMATPNNIAIK